MMRFTVSDIQKFCEASGDQNPLHHSDLYSRKTPFGEPIVHGMLSVLESLRFLGDRLGQRLSEISVDFRNPALMEIDYQVGVEKEGEGNVAVRVMDGDQCIFKSSLRFDHQKKNEDICLQEGKRGLRGWARTLSIQEVGEIKPVEIEYRPSMTYVRSFLNEKALRDRGVGSLHLAVLMGCSYVVGMEIPGREALLRSIHVQFEQDSVEAEGTLRMVATVEEFDERFGLVTVGICFDLGVGRVAKAAVKAFLRPPPVSDRPRRKRFVYESSGELKDKVALIVGGSRGLGAQMVQALVWRGATVMTSYLKCRKQAEELKSSLEGAPGKLILCQGDASDAPWSESLGDRIAQDFGKVDILICNACPSIKPIRFHRNTIGRINQFVEESLRLVTVPIASFLGLLKKGDGICVLISSQALENYPLEWPHYVASKAAGEAILEVLSKQHSSLSFIKVRPPKILTDQMNSNLGQYSSLDPETVATVVTEKIIKFSAEEARGESVYLLREFDRVPVD